MSRISVSIDAGSDLFSDCQVIWCWNLDRGIGKPRVPNVAVVIDGIKVYLETVGQIDQIMAAMSDARAQLKALIAENAMSTVTRDKAHDEGCALIDTNHPGDCVQPQPISGFDAYLVALSKETHKPQPVVAAMQRMEVEF
jgi:hypothetical protein